MRPRKANLHLPPCVYHRHGAFWLVKRGKWERLGADLPSALAKYARRFEGPKGGMAALIAGALAAITPRLAPNTAAQYATAGRKLAHVFQNFAPEQVKPRDVAQFRRAFDSQPNMTNRCLSLLRQVFDYAMEEQLIESNPAIGIKRLPERQRERLISRAEFDAIYAHASPRLQCMMGLWYLTGQRVMDVVAIHRADVREEGIYFRQAKTDARLLVKWSPELRAVVERAKTLNGMVSSMTLFSTRRGPTRGAAPSYGTVRDQWQAACKVAGVADAELRDLRAMSGTAAEGQGLDPTALLGHTSAGMTRRYLRAKKVPEVEGPSFGHPQDRILTLDKKGK